MFAISEIFLFFNNTNYKQFRMIRFDPLEAPVVLTSPNLAEMEYLGPNMAHIIFFGPSIKLTYASPISSQVRQLPASFPSVPLSPAKKQVTGSSLHFYCSIIPYISIFSQFKIQHIQNSFSYEKNHVSSINFSPIRRY